ncbi:MAG: glycine cleavage system protein H [Magnetovibrio sp.]|nr:glycine cleavage system protein H [Magnetovibrio sp.]
MTTKYSQDHEWISIDDSIGTVGITDFAQEQLGDVVFVETPEVGTQLTKGDEVGIVESVKAASEIYTPVSGEVTEVNSSLEDTPEKVNSDPMGTGWFFKIRLSNEAELNQLMDDDAYIAFISDNS